MDGAVGDLSANPSGSRIALARESGLHEIAVIETDGAREIPIPLPDGMRHGWRALHWIDDDRIVVGTMELEGPGGWIGYRSMSECRWIWEERFPDFGGESQVMAMDVHRGTSSLVAAAINLANAIMLLDAGSGVRLGRIVIHDTGAMMHMIAFDSRGARIASIDRAGFCEVWDIAREPQMLVRFALSLGALTSFLFREDETVLGTEGGRLLRFGIGRI